jgi:hypothetical protein
MADPSSQSGSDAGRSGSTTTGTPRWAKTFGIIAIVLALLLIIVLLAGGDHGPGRHTSFGDTARAGTTQYQSAGDHASRVGSHEWP